MPRGTLDMPASWSADGRKWSNPNLLDRAIKAINDKAKKSLADLQRFKIMRREQNKVGRTRPVHYYWLAAGRPQ